MIQTNWMIREHEPQMPSSRLGHQEGSDSASTAKGHGTDAPKLINSEGRIWTISKRFGGGSERTIRQRAGALGWKRRGFSLWRLELEKSVGRLAE